VRSAQTTEEAVEILEQVPVDLVVTDLRVPELGGLDILRRIREHYPEVADESSKKKSRFSNRR